MLRILRLRFLNKSLFKLIFFILLVSFICNLAISICRYENSSKNIEKNVLQKLSDKNLEENIIKSNDFSTKSTNLLISSNKNEVVFDEIKQSTTSKATSTDNNKNQQGNTIKPNHLLPSPSNIEKNVLQKNSDFDESKQSTISKATSTDNNKTCVFDNFEYKFHQWSQVAETHQHRDCSNTKLLTVENDGTVRLEPGVTECTFKTIQWSGNDFKSKESDEKDLNNTNKLNENEEFFVVTCLKDNKEVEGK